MYVGPPGLKGSSYTMSAANVSAVHAGQELVFELAQVGTSLRTSITSETVRNIQIIHCYNINRVVDCQTTLQIVLLACVLTLCQCCPCYINAIASCRTCKRL
eukprot:COSAG06_NODE_15322_length_1080_cov_1.829766_1_plen_102_part_00